MLRFFKNRLPYYLIQAKSSHGILFNLDPEDYLDNIVLKTGYFEEEVLTALLKYVETDGVLWDVGANIGLHSITVKHLRPGCQVVCFEPSPFTFSRLYLNANLNQAGLIMLNVGLGSEAGFSKLSLRISGNSGQTSFKPWSDVDYRQAMLCYCENAANIIRNGVAPMPTVVKIDVEGFEFEVLSGFKDLLGNPVLKAIVFESPSDFLKNSGQYPLYELFERAGYQIAELVPPKVEAETSHTSNFVATRV